MTTTPQPNDAAAAAAPDIGRILVVDDDEANRLSLSRRLTRRGYSVDLAEDGPQSLAAIEAGDYDLVLLDVMMPGMSGLEVLTEVRKTRTAAELPIVMATARDASEDVVEALNLGANDYVTKPLDFAVAVARVATQISLRRSVREVKQLQERLAAKNAELLEANDDLTRAAERVQREMGMASALQKTFLPSRNPDEERLLLSWRFLPCEGLAGDGLGAIRLGPDHVALFLFDVSGHGVAAALTAVAASRMLSPPTDPSTILVDVPDDAEGAAPVPVDPETVIAELGARFPFTLQRTQFLTVFYGLLHLPTRKLCYASAGHPPAIYVRPDGSVERLDSTGPPAGIGEGSAQTEVQLDVGGRLYVYSDGVTEAAPDADDDAVAPTPDEYGVDRLADLLTSKTSLNLAVTVEAVEQDLDRYRRGGPAKDDVSILAIELR